MEISTKTKVYNLNIIILGYKDTGKTKLINSIIEPNKKTDKYNPTIGAELKYGLIETKINNPYYNTFIIYNIYIIIYYFILDKEIIKIL